MNNNPKKIGILTFHSEFNHGALLQTYCLQQLLQNLYENCEVEIINYTSARHIVLSYLLLIYKIFKPKIVYENIKKMMIFKNFQKSYLNLTKPIFSKYQLSKKEYDLLILGSDEIWNYNNILTGFDPVYFGKYIKSKFKMTYAVSFGSVNAKSKINKEIFHLVKNIDLISVRDINTQKIVKKITKEYPLLVLDPTFLFQIKDIENYNNINSKFSLVYLTNLRDKEIINSIINYSKRSNMPIISVGNSFKWAQKSYVCTYPFEFLSFFNNSSYIITSTYHGVIFSILFKKKFAVIVPKNKKNKIFSLLKSLDLEDRLVKTSGIKEIIEKDINYRRVFNTINNESRVSIGFLKNTNLV